MINPQIEKECVFPPQAIYDICDFSVQAAYDDGFMNSYVFGRALYVFAAIYLYEEDELKSIAAQNINDAWKYLLDNDTIQEMESNYKDDLGLLCEIGMQWYDDYTTYAHSARGLLNTIQMFTGDIVASAAEQFKQINESGEIQNVLNIADSWGMNNADGAELVDNESLFAE